MYYLLTLLAVQALIMAHEAQTFYGQILRSTKGIIFLSTPHRGADLASWMSIFTNLINVASFGQGIRKDLIKNVERDSSLLIAISNQFIHRATALKIMSFTEQMIERPMNTLVRTATRQTSRIPESDS